jgi:hypothetical protein
MLAVQCTCCIGAKLLNINMALNTVALTVFTSTIAGMGRRPSPQPCLCSRNQHTADRSLSHQATLIDRNSMQNTLLQLHSKPHALNIASALRTSTFTRMTPIGLWHSAVLVHGGMASSGGSCKGQQPDPLMSYHIEPQHRTALQDPHVAVS